MGVSPSKGRLGSNDSNSVLIWLVAVAVCCTPFAGAGDVNASRMRLGFLSARRRIRLARGSVEPEVGGTNDGGGGCLRAAQPASLPHRQHGGEHFELHLMERVHVARAVDNPSRALSIKHLLFAVVLQWQSYTRISGLHLVRESQVRTKRCTPLTAPLRPRAAPGDRALPPPPPCSTRWCLGT